MAGSPLLEAGDQALADTPDAARWARARLTEWTVRPTELVRNGCEAIVRTAVVGIAQACVPDTDERLIRLLGEAIDDAELFVGIETSADLPMQAPVAERLAANA
jgi:hypothetical protein